LRRRSVKYASVDHISTHTTPPPEFDKGPPDHVPKTGLVELSNTPIAYEVQGAIRPKSRNIDPFEMG